MHLHVHKGDLSEGVESADPQLCPVGPLGPQLCSVSFRATGVFSLFGYQVFPSSVLSLSVRSEADTAGVTLCLFQCSHCSETEQKRLPLLTYRTAVRFRSNTCVRAVTRAVERQYSCSQPVHAPMLRVPEQDQYPCHIC